MHHIQTDDWLRTTAGEPRGYIQPERLHELWIHTGTICNLECPFCLEGSKPGDDRIQKITFEDARPFIDEARALGVDRFSFTGGEPFVIKDMVDILDYALDTHPCLVLTNGTKPILLRLPQILPLRDKPHPLRFRISLDYPDPERHDAGRGAGTFRLALSTAGKLHELGFAVSIARQTDADEDAAAVDAAFRRHFETVGLPSDTHLHSFPDLMPPGATPDVPQVTEHCMTEYQDESSRAAFMCNSTKFVLKKDGAMRVYACTLVDDDPDYDLGATLAESMSVRVMLRHHRCYACFAFGATCSESA